MSMDELNGQQLPVLSESETDDRIRYAAALTVVNSAGDRDQVRQALGMLGLLDVVRPEGPCPSRKG